ncbi:MAG: BatA domain-containing protein, partial [Trueperaceae bacterium]|nr:BatA domain-containing protein [Trueperaceae bacterium]
MSWFLNPGMLLFAACGAIPVIIHLFNRQQYKRIAWAAMEFLLAAIKRTQSRLRLENLLLLLARIAIMILLALALAQPLLENNPLAGLESSETHLILVIDNSYSMGLTRAGRPSPLETARGLASEMLGRLDASRGDKVSLIMMSDEPDAVIAEPSMQIDFAKKKVLELELSDYGTSAIRTLPLALAAAKKSTNARKDLILLTDAQRLAWNLEESEKDKFHQMLTELSAVPGMNIRIIDVGAEDTANVAVERVTSADAVIGVNQSYKFSARLHNFGRTESQRYLTWYVDGTKHDAVAVTIGAGEEATVDLNLVLPEAGPHTLTAELDADAVSADNKASLAFDAKQSVQVLLVDGEPSSDTFDDEVIFLRLALNPSMTADERVTLYDIETVRDIVFSETDVRRYDLVIIANLEMIYEENATNLEAYVKAGGGVLFFLGKRINPKGWNDMLYK